MNTVILIITYILFLIGIAGCILPMLPGTPIVFLGVFIYAWKNGFVLISQKLLIIFLVLTAFSVVLDYIAGSIGSKKMGASKFGVIGALFGAIIGAFFAPWGIILGPPLGALIGEMFSGKDFRDASKAGGGAILGLLGGAITKIVVSLIMITLFTFRVFFGG